MSRKSGGKTGRIWGLGGHVIATGLLGLIDLMDRGFVSAVAVNGSVPGTMTPRRFPVGFTSEDVDATLGKGDRRGTRDRVTF